MQITQLTYRRGLMIPVHLLLVLLIGTGVMVPQAVAHLGCDHACCSDATGSGMPRHVIQSAAPAPPPCCSPLSSDTCHLCQLDKLPLPDLALQAGQGADGPNTHSVAAINHTLTADTGLHSADGSGASAVERHPPPLYIQHLSLLI